MQQKRDNPKTKRSRSNGDGDGDGDCIPNPSGRFVVYLPHDEEGVDAQDTHEMAHDMNNRLSALLKMSHSDFSIVVATDVSLHEFLDSYLQFRKRWYDLPYHNLTGSMAGLGVADKELSRRIFMVLYRMSLNQDFGAPVRKSLSSKEHADLFPGERFLDIPKLMDISAIFEHDNSDLTQSLVFNALESHPGLVDKLKEVIPQFLHIVDTMHHRCCSSLECLPFSGNKGTLLNRQLHDDILEVLDFINDAVVTLDAFLEAYAPGAAVFISFGISKEGNKELLPMLAYVHDSLLPVLEKGFGLTAENASNFAPVQLCLKTLRARIVKFSWKLLYSCYLDETYNEDNFYHPSSKIFPVKVEDPVVRGDIIVQLIGEIPVLSSSSVDGPSSSELFLWSLNRRHKLMNRIDELCQTRWMRLDETQYDYIYHLVGKPQKLSDNSMTDRNPDMSILASDYKFNHEEEDAILQSKISQIKDIFPSYGDGFLSACLDVYNDNPEEVIQHILEGTLHEDLLSSDITLQVKTSNKQSSLNKNVKGKGRVDESAYLAQETSKIDSSCLNKVTASSSLSLSPDTKFSAAGRYVRHSKDDVNNVNILDQQDVKDSFRLAILASQYEDEYDDSFDELGTGVVDSGIEEIESLNIRHLSQPGQWRSEEASIGDVGPSRKLNDSMDARTSREKSVNISHKKLASELSHLDLGSSAPSVKTGDRSYGRGKYKEKQKPQFYVKDGKNYSYKVAGAVAVSSVDEAEAHKRAEEETIYGLGPGGNVPTKQIESSSGATPDHNVDAYGNRATRGGSQSGRGGYGRGGVQGDKVAYVRKNNDNHHRKDRAMKKHFANLGGN